MTNKSEFGMVAKPTKGAAPRRQHFVPQFYLRGFAGEKGQLFVIDRPTERTFRTSPKNVAAERDFNRVDVEGMEPDTVEKALSEFEGQVAPALERIKSTKSLAVKADRDAMMNLMGALTLRNPRQREQISDIIGGVAQRVVEEGLATKERWESQVAQMMAAGKWDDNADVSYEEMKSTVAKRGYRIEVAREFKIAMELEQHDRLVQNFGNRKWQMLVANEGSGGFVTTDHPICLVWSDGEDHGYLSPGFGARGTEVIFPISTKLALRGTFEGEENVVDADIFTVGSINSIIISNAQKQVYANNYSFNYMRPLPEEIGSGATLVQDKKFLAAGKEAPEANVIALSAK